MDEETGKVSQSRRGKKVEKSLVISAPAVLIIPRGFQPLSRVGTCGERSIFDGSSRSAGDGCSRDHHLLQMRHWMGGSRDRQAASPLGIVFGLIILCF